MKKLALLLLFIACAAASPARISIFGDDDDDFDPFYIFRSHPFHSKKPQSPDTSFFSSFFNFKPFFTFDMDMNPMSDPKTKLHNNTLEEKEINGNKVVSNSSYFVNEETGAVIKTQTINVVPIKVKPATEHPVKTDENTSKPVAAEETTQPESTPKTVKDKENEVVEDNGEVADLISK